MPKQPNTAMQAARSVMRQASVLLNRQHYAEDVGYSFIDPTTGIALRDVYRALGYNRTIVFAQYKARYERGGIAERIVEALPAAAWTGGASIIEDPDVDVNTPFETAVDKLFTRLKAWQKFEKADILSRIGQYGGVLIGAPGSLDTTLPQLDSPDDIFYLTPLSEQTARIDRVIEDPSNPRYGQPEFYRVRLHSGNEVKVHWTRVIHNANGALDDEIYGKPALRAVWNYLDDLEKLVGGGSEAAWKNMNPGFQLNLDPEVEFDTDELDKMEDEAEEYEHGYSRKMLTRGMQVTQFEVSVADFNKNVDTVFQLISGVTGIPTRILTGSERGELASTEDKNNWNDSVAGYRKEHCIPLLQTFIDRLIEFGALPSAEYIVTFSEIDELDERQKAELVKDIAEANKFQAAAGGTVIMTDDEVRDRVYGLKPLTPEQKSQFAPRTPEETADNKVVDQTDPNSRERAAPGAVITRKPSPNSINEALDSVYLQ